MESLAYFSRSSACPFGMPCWRRWALLVEGDKAMVFGLSENCPNYKAVYAYIKMVFSFELLFRLTYCFQEPVVVGSYESISVECLSGV